MKFILLSVILSVIFISNVFGDAPLWRYTDKTTGEEQGISYSDKPLNNPDWNCEQITEKDKQKYIDLQNEQFQDKKRTNELLRKEKVKRIKDKLKDLGISQSDLDDIIK